MDMIEKRIVHFTNLPSKSCHVSKCTYINPKYFNLYTVNPYSFKGAGGPRLEDGQNRVLWVFLTEGDPSYQMLFTWSKILFLTKVIAFWNFENTGYYNMCANFYRDFPKMTIFGISKPIFTYIFYLIILKL